MNHFMNAPAISGEDFTRRSTTRWIFTSVAVMVASALLIYGAFSYFEEDTAQGVLGCIGAVGLIWALSRHLQTCEYADGTVNRKVTLDLLTCEGHIRWVSEIPLSCFSTVVVRHVCHPGGEGQNTFTGSVGLKPAEGPIHWVKEFPATQHGLPIEADNLARDLSTLTGLPYLGDFPFSRVPLLPPLGTAASLAQTTSLDETRHERV